MGIVQQWPSIDWHKFYYIWDRLPLDMKHVGQVVGMQEGYLIKALKGNPPERTQAQKEKVLVHCRFFVSLVLHDLVKEIKLGAISEKYGTSKGFLQSLQLAAGTFSGMVTVFCNRLGWKNMEVLLSQFQNRLVFGVEKELCELVDISILNGRHARFLYNNGYHSLSDLATANISVLESLLRKAFPFKSTNYNHWFNKGRCITEYEAALMITQEARQLLCERLNVPESYFFWNNLQSDNVVQQGNTNKSTPMLTQHEKTPGLNDHRTAIIKSKRLKLEDKSSPFSNASVQKSSFDLFMEYNDDHARKIPADEHSSIVLVHTSNFNKTFANLTSQHTTITSGIRIVNVCANEVLLEMFVKNCSHQSLIGFSVAVESISNIGSAFANNNTTNHVKGLPIKTGQVMGVSFTWEDTMIVYYLSLCESFNEALDGEGVPLSVRIKALTNIFSNDHSYTLVSLSFKQQVKYLMASCGLELFGKSYDPHLAYWMLNPDSTKMSLNQLTDKYVPQQPTVTDGKGSTVPLTSFVVHSTVSHIQAAAKSMLGLSLMIGMKKFFPSEYFLNAFIENEMPVNCVLAKLELNGIGICTQECESLKNTLEKILSNIKEQAFVHAKRPFSLSSPKEVEQVLFHELKLPSFHAEVFWSDQLIHLRTTKDVLSKISSIHPLPGLILDWRRVSNTATSIKPLLMCEYNQLLQQYRAHSSCHLHTATGRITLTNPNIQNVPKEYTLSTCTPMDFPPTIINARSVVKSCSGCVLVAADYSQLELRILAHLSRDEKLCKFLNKEGDVFRKIAGEWLGIDPCDVSEEERQRTKSLCYGMIYGMGSKSLGNQLDISEEQASKIIETFKSRYTGMRDFMAGTIEQCKNNGYVETILNRRRYLWAIHSKNITEKTKAERQAVNSTIQGSAADLVKKAMIAINHALTNNGLVTYVCSPSQALKDSNNRALLVLQLHDELMYEVDEEKLHEVAVIIKTEMESALSLAVKLPVKLKVGRSWGNMEPYSELK